MEEATTQQPKPGKVLAKNAKELGKKYAGKAKKKDKKPKETVPSYPKPAQISETGLVSDLNSMKHPGEYMEFLLFMALPRALRVEVCGAKDQRELAKKFGVGEDTLSEWKQREGFREDVDRLRRDFFRERTGDVLLAVETKAIRTGDAAEAKLLLEFTGELKKDEDASKVPELLAQTIARIAKVLPDRPKKT